ncbi:unnamed protein product [Camellia sinensis]
MNLIKERLHSKRVLIVLDDVDQLTQLSTLAGNRDWFGPGSRIIITTRDEHLLKGLKVDERYMAMELNHEESLQLFSWHAFGKTNPLENYADLANGIVSYASGLPLALEVLGSYLFGRNMVEWKSAFDKLQQIPHEEIQKRLRISFDALDDDKIKDIFLDIAFFFIGMDKDYAITILNGCGFFAEIGISVLISRCLLRNSENNQLMMHDLVREIIREKYAKEPEKRSRLWFHEDVCYVLEKNKGTEAVEGVILILPMLKKIQWSNKAFVGMPKLRLLRINRVHLCGNFEHLFEELRWLCWHYCLLEYLPSNFHPKKLVILDMQFSKFKTLWTDGKHFKSLKILNLSNSKCLTKSPIFCALSMLEELQLERCTSLMELRESIGLLDKLVYLNLKDCMNLRFLPGSICKLKSVERLNLTGCTKLEEFPEHLGHMESLTELLADRTIIKQLPFSIGLLKNLRRLSLKGCNRQFTTKSWFSLILSWVLQRKNVHSIRFLPSSISSLCSLTKLDLNYRNLSEGDFLADLRSLSSLRVLDLGGNNFRSLSHGFNHLSKLEDLSLDNCTSLQSISDLPPNLCTIYACNCSSLEKISDLPRRLKTLKMWLGKHQFHHFLSNLNNDGMEDPHCFQGARIIPSNRLNNLQTPLQSPYSRDYFYSGDISYIFSYKITGSSSISLEVPIVRGKDEYVAGFDVGVVYYRAGDEEGYSTELDDYPYVIITDKINDIDFTYTPIFFGIPESRGDYVWSSDIIVEEHFGYGIKGVVFIFYKGLWHFCGENIIVMEDLSSENQQISIHVKQSEGNEVRVFIFYKGLWHFCGENIIVMEDLSSENQQISIHVKQSEGNEY